MSSLSQLSPSVGGVHLCSRLDRALLQRDLPGRVLRRRLRGDVRLHQRSRLRRQQRRLRLRSRVHSKCERKMADVPAPQSPSPPRSPEHLLLSEEVESDSAELLFQHMYDGSVWRSFSSRCRTRTRSFISCC
ncbi:unnamed protein product [Pleuronectes platessa]|uniref:Uncharacterized protein n=1 Tax=Pleuronectes platessa TaxID=8262 RepID=A0A9N7USB1_PLEPL|nr:unnamed protein product [Pleuronectes platessa]